MTGINTSLGINSVASHIAGLEANGAQVVTTNTGAQVTGLEAAAYEFGAILSSYPADAPPLTRNAAVFQVTDADGNTSMMSLNDLATKIQQQTGYDPLVEFSAGIGTTSAGYNLADINQVLSSIERQYATMSFTQLTQIQLNQDLAVTELDDQSEDAVQELLGTLKLSQSLISQSLTGSPYGIGLDEPLFWDTQLSPLSQEEIAAGASSLISIGQAIAEDFVAIDTLFAELAQLGDVNQNFSAEDLKLIGEAEVGMNKLTWPTQAAEQLAIDVAQDEVAAAEAAYTAALSQIGVNTTVPLPILEGLSSAFDTIQAILNSPANQGRTTFEEMVNANVGNFFMRSSNLFLGENVPNSGEGGYDYELVIYSDRSDLNGITFEQANALFPGITLSQYLDGGRGAPGYSFEEYYNLPAFTRPQSVTEIGGPSGGPPFSGLYAACGINPENSAEVDQFRAYLEAIVPGITDTFDAAPITNLTDLITLRNAVNTAIENYTEAQAIDPKIAQEIASASEFLESKQQALLERNQIYAGNYDLVRDQAIQAFEQAVQTAVNNRNERIGDIGTELSAALASLAEHRQAITDNPFFAWSVSRAGSPISGVQQQILDTTEELLEVTNSIASIQQEILNRNDRIFLSNTLLNRFPGIEARVDEANLEESENSSGFGGSIYAAYAAECAAAFPDHGPWWGTGWVANSILPDELLARGNNQIATDTAALAGLYQQLPALRASRDELQSQLDQLHEELVTPRAMASFNEMIDFIKLHAGEDIEEALESIVGDGPITPQMLNQIYSAINQSLPIGATQIPLLNDGQLINIALSQLQSALSQESFISALNSPGGLSRTSAIFLIPGANGAVSFDQLLGTISQSTGANLSASLNSIPGIGQDLNLNPGSVNDLNQYLMAMLGQGNQNELKDFADIPAITVTHAELDLSGLDDVLNSFTVEPNVANALRFIGNALPQLAIGDLNPDGSLSLDRACFTFEDNEIYGSLGLSSSDVSLNQIIDYCGIAYGVDLARALPNLSDADGNISAPNLSNLIQVINQAVEDANISPLASILNIPLTSYLSVGDATLSVAGAKSALQNIRFEDVELAVAAGQASAAVTASLTQGMGVGGAPVLSAAEAISQLEDGDLYVNARGQFFLNRQPTNARDAAVAAFVIGGNSLNDQLADLMNHVNLNNSKILMANHLSAATSVSDLQDRIQEMRDQYGFEDILNEITGGALTDADIDDDIDVSGATGTFQSTLKTAINNATNNQDLDTQSLQTLTAQIQANNTAMTQLLQSFEQLLRSLTQNF